MNNVISVSPRFVHLRVRSEFSLVDSVIKLKPMIQACGEKDLAAIALTDHTNFYGLVKFYKAATNAGIKPIVGCDFILEGEGGDAVFTLLAMNDQGYRNITEIISLGYLKGQTFGSDAKIKWEWLEQYNEGVIALSGAKFGEIGRALLKGNFDQAGRVLDKWMSLYPHRFYIELQRTGRAQDENHLHEAVALAAQKVCPVVATNDVRFINNKAYDAHEARVCIHDGEVLDNAKRERRYSKEQSLKSADEMCQLFSDIPSAIQNTIEIAKRCNVQLHLGEYFLPEYPVPDNLRQDAYFQIVSYETLEQQTRQSLEKKWAGKENTPEYEKELLTGVFFRQISLKGLDKRLDFLYDSNQLDFPAIKAKYIDRINFELNIILEMGFPGYFLIVMDFIQWAKDQDIPVGPGRGSGAGSLVAYAQNITDLDPIKYDLLFERFLNPERISMPDFDVDFCMDRRDEVINYVVQRYGRMAVSQIVTFGTMAAKAVIRDVARVLSKSYGVADKLSKMIPFDVGITLEKAYEQEEQIRDFVKNDNDGQEIWEMALQLEGTVRGVGKHAGGVVISPTKLTDFSPICCDENGDGMVTQFDKDDVEDAGLVKFDFLGLRTLTIIDWATKTIDSKRKSSDEPKLDIMAIPLDDKLTFDLLKRAETTAVFQLESRGMKDLIKRLKPDNLEDMIALVALFRPGPLDSGMVDDFVNRKHGRAEVAYPDARYQHESLKPILEPTYGVIVYQEQVMQIAQVLAGYSLGGADMLRRAMGKKKPEEMAKQRSIFQEGAASQGIDPTLAIKIFDLVEKFAGYGFNKSHSAAYALVSYQTAWLKTHYPAAFMAAVMSSELQNTDKIVILIEECREMGLSLINPDVNDGAYMFTVNDKEEIVYGLGAIKGLGEGPVTNVIEARKDGPFTDLFDFCLRINTRKVNKRALEALIKCGAFDSLGEPRHVLFAAMVEAVKTAEKQVENASAGMIDLFGEVEAETQGDVYENYRNVTVVPNWTAKERLGGEKETLGLFLTGHPIDEYERDLKQLKCKRLGKLIPDKRLQLIAGMIVGTRYVKTKRGDKMAIVTLDDRTARIDVTIFSKLLPDVQDKLGQDNIVFIRGEVERDDYSSSLRMRAESILDMSQIRSQGGRRLTLIVESDQWNQKNKAVLEGLMYRSNDTGIKLAIEYHNTDAKGVLVLSDDYRIKPDDDNIDQLQRHFGAANVLFQ